LQTGFNEHLFVGYDGLDEKFAFIVIPVLKAGVVPNYKLVLSPEDDVFINFDKMLDSSKVKEAILSVITPTEFLEKEIVNKPKRVRRKIVVASSSTESFKKSSSSSIAIVPQTKKRKKVIVKNTNAKTKKKNN
jgi:hypothetical protein